MNAKTNDLELTAPEWAIIVQLLERQRALLPVEIRHSATRGMKHDLRERLELIEQLLAKLERGIPKAEDSSWGATANC